MKKFITKNKTYIFPTAFVLIAGLSLFNLTSSGPTIQWTPEKIEQEIFTGTTKVVSAQFISKKDLENVQIWTTPELEDFITVVPDFFDKIDKNETQQIEIISSVPLDTPVTTYSGTIHLKSTTKSKRTYSQTLKVTLNIKEPTIKKL